MLLFALLYFACLLCFNLLAWIDLLALFALRSRFHLTRFGLCPLDLIWLGRLASWHALDLEYIYMYIYNTLFRKATICDASLGRFHLSRLDLSPLGLVWLGRLARWHILDFEQKIP